MGQILAIDYGKVRTGIAVTDDMQIIASGLTTVETPKLIDFLKKYFLEKQRRRSGYRTSHRFERKYVRHRD